MQKSEILWTVLFLAFCLTPKTWKSKQHQNSLHTETCTVSFLRHKEKLLTTGIPIWSLAENIQNTDP